MYRQLPVLAVVSALFLISFLQPAAAEIGWNDNCTAGLFWRNATLCIDGTCSQLTQPPVACASGCAANGLMCNSADNVPTEYIMFSAIAMLLTAAIVFYVGYKLGTGGETKSGNYIAFMFFASGIILIIIAMGVLGAFFTAQPDAITLVVGAGFIMFVIIFVLIIFIFLVEFLVSHLKAVKFKKGYR